MQHTSGLLYGTAQEGGTNSLGTIYKLNLGLGPFISLVNYSGAVGQTVQILGQNLNGSTAVTINGVSASFSVLTNTYMTAIIPAGASTGPVVVTTSTGTLTSNKNLQVVQ